jgi:carotenoid cleavage dioxygenase-like enzyme
MNRRSFIQKAGLLGLAATLPQPLWAMMQDNKQAFLKALAQHPELLAYASVDRERDIDSLTIEGKIPEEFNGTLYRNGPAMLERNGIRYTHLFEGDGMIRAYHFKDGQVAYKDRFVKTPKYIEEQKAGHFLYSGAATNIANSRAVTSPDMINVANTNVITVGDDIWALWEAGSATCLSGNNLETKGFVNLGDGLKGMPFSAHPKVDANGHIWNFGLDYSSGRVVFYHLSPSGKLLKAGMIKTDYHAMLHDFLITENHILLILPSLDMSGHGGGFFNQMAYNSDQPLRLIVVDKNTLKVTARHDLPPGFIFHFGNGWEDLDGTIHFDCCHYDNFDIMAEFGDLMQGKISTSTPSNAQTIIYHITKDGKISCDKIAGNAEFPRIYPHMAGLKNQALFQTSTLSDNNWQDGVRRIDMDSGKIDLYHYGDDFMVEEHVVVEGPQGNKQSGGWLVGAALHIPSKRTCVNIFDADNLAAGPRARCWLNFAAPIGFHGHFIKR